jgi:RNA polymerase sigma factor (sigma-70 family)
VRSNPGAPKNAIRTKEESAGQLGSKDRELSAFCDREYPSLAGMLSLYCGDAVVAEDLAQEALIKACRDWRRVRKMDRPDAWLRTVALNAARSRFRRLQAERRAQGRLEILGSVRAEEPDPSTAIAIRSAIAELPHREKAVLLLHYYGDFTYAMVSGLLGIPEGTVKGLARKAVKRLRDQGLIDLKEVANVD